MLAFHGGKGRGAVDEGRWMDTGGPRWLVGRCICGKLDSQRDGRLDEI